MTAVQGVKRQLKESDERKKIAKTIHDTVQSKECDVGDQRATYH